ncbi:hypothetical protein [Pseudomonas sp. LB3P25]
MMEHSYPLKVVNQEKIESLRDRMDAAGCIFEFVVVVPYRDVDIDEAVHRRALSELYQQIMAGQREWHRRLVQTLPDADYPEPNMTWDLEKATATLLTQTQVRSLTLTEGFEPGSLRLYDHFRESQNLSTLDEAKGCAKDLFRDWLEVLGLEERDDVVVFNWIKANRAGSPPEDFPPGCEPWSEYFSLGEEWRSGWCLTIWNPRHRLLSAIAASGASREQYERFDDSRDA